MRSIISILFSILLMTQCTNSDSDCTDQEFSLTGSWQLLEFCFSPGDASCPIQTPEDDRIFVFSSDSTYTYSSADVVSQGSFSISNNIMTFMADMEQQTLNDLFVVPISSCRLELNPLCIEQCTSLFEKVD